ncbi:MAG: dockerin type I repeat-containing protein [Clostridia bacterium]|nr:dockerin type I repeat-containing protein [Clostridia bacterium]
MKKKILSLLLVMVLVVAALPLSATTAVAENDRPTPTTGPWEGYYWMTGGPMISFSGGSEEHLIYYRKNMMNESSPMIIDNEAVSGATYDKATNTLTLDNVKLTDNLGVYYMGDDFKLRIEGECELKKISVFNFSGKYSTSLNITGTGTLTLNKEKTYNEAIEFYSEGESLTHLDIASSVTVHLYASEYADEEFPQNVVNINSTYADPAITVGGKAIPEAKSERRVETVSETVNALWLENTEHVYQRGKRVISKNDPDGIYAVEEIEFNTGSGYEPRLCVTKYIQSPFGIDMPDPEFTEEYGDSIILTQEEFDAEYDYVTEPQPKKIRYTTEYRERNRGYRGVKFIKDGDPDVVYIGTPGWTTPYGNKLDEINSYILYSAYWDDNEQLYVAERTAIERYKTAEELEAKGYTVVTEGDRRVEVQYIDSSYTYNDYSSEEIALTKDGEPGAYYMTQLAKDADGSEKYFVPSFSLRWNEATGHYYSPFDSGWVFGSVYDSVEEMAADGYHMILEDQPVDYTITGSVQALPRPLYRDQAGNRYFYNFDYNLYSISNENTFTYGDKEYYIGTLAEGVNEDELQAVGHDEIRDDYKWWIEGTEYHHTGSEASDVLIGDLDGNGIVNTNDALMALRAAVGITKLDANQILAGDVTGDRKVTTEDALLILKHAVGIIKLFPVEA